MGKLKALIIVVIILLVSLVFGFFLIQNQHNIMVDFLYQVQLVEVSVGRLSLGFFFFGLFFGVFLCAAICAMLMMELSASRREARKLSKQLEKLRERSLKEST